MSDLSVAPVQSAPTTSTTSAGTATSGEATVAELMTVKDTVQLSPEGRALMERQQTEQLLEEADREKPKKTKDPHPKSTGDQ